MESIGYCHTTERITGKHFHGENTHENTVHHIQIDNDARDAYIVRHHDRQQCFVM